MNRTLRKQLTGVALLAATVVIGGNVAAQSEQSPAYWYDSAGNVWKNPYGECWRTSAWSTENAIKECDPDLFAEAPPPPPPPPAYEKITLGADVLFAFDKADLKPTARDRLNELVQKVDTFPKLDHVRVSGYTDQIGSDAYNDRLSERRAHSVESYLLANSRTLRAAQVEAIGMGERNPVVPFEDCKRESRNRAELIECLQPNRRVEVEVVGEGYVEQR